MIAEMIYHNDVLLAFFCPFLLKLILDTTLVFIWELFQ